MDIEDIMRDSKEYRKILEHRRHCSEWGRGFCLKCFGDGLTKFSGKLLKEIAEAK